MGGLAEETEGLEDDVGRADDDERTGEAADELAGIEATELEAVSAGAYDDEVGAANIRAKARARVRQRARKASVRGQHRVAERITQAVVMRTSKANRIVPLFKKDIPPGQSAKFTYKAPEPCKFLGISMSQTMIANFGGTELMFGTERLIEPAGISGGDPEDAISLALFDPQARKDLVIGRGRIIGLNAAEWVFEVVHLGVTPTPLTFIATLELFRMNQRSG